MGKVKIREPKKISKFDPSDADLSSPSQINFSNVIGVSSHQDSKQESVENPSLSEGMEVGGQKSEELKYFDVCLSMHSLQIQRKGKIEKIDWPKIQTLNLNEEINRNAFSSSTISSPKKLLLRDGRLSNRLVRFQGTLTKARARGRLYRISRQNDNHPVI